ncbi:MULTISPECIES: hypothetical protein [unclassified Coleofasciculus]|uniref:hypothetical protein n=1 Tax=unclassified Coleofasciculus TaxID=2692782 RepID=UPI00188015D8|nr:MULTISPECIES: hypothetical protein [unclassified Coleofasciculus]MBE9126906.1 hypothetical protein [Coleofasciculus sp. LEGE 07081]MBE9150198.1 hypothetical protein [Coleofasciculus sp. LEGE 07092]
MMLKLSLFQQPWLTSLLTPLTLGVAWMISGQMPVDARPVVIRSQSSSSYIYGSPIPAPVPVNPVTGQPSAFTPYNYDYGNDYRVRRPIRGSIRNSTLINPTIIDSQISDSVLIDPVIIDSSRSARRRIQRSGVIYTSPGIRIQIGQ